MTAGTHIQIRNNTGHQHSHLLRFANETLPETKVIPHLSALIQTYFTTMNAIGAETWIMHGTLLAWWWNQKVRITESNNQHP
jgi:hypothetical protein